MKKAPRRTARAVPARGGAQRSEPEAPARAGGRRTEPEAPARHSAAERIRLFTIGFAEKSAEEFFETLRRADVTKLIDIRLKNVSQLAGFTKKRDLEYFLRAILGVAYEHEPLLAPTADILDAYKKDGIDWAEYERRFDALLAERKPERSMSPQRFDRACLLCSEPTAEHCHRRLVAERFERAWGNLETTHL